MKRSAIIVIAALLSATLLGGIIGAQAQDYNEEKEEIVSDIEREIQEREAEIQRLREQAQQYRTEVKKAQQQKSSLERELAIINGRIRALEVDIAVTENQISSTSLRIAQITGDIALKEKEIKTTLDRMAAIVRTLDRQDDETLFEMALRYDAFSDALTNYDYLSRLSDVLGDELLELRLLKEDLEQQRQKAEERKTELERLNNQLGSQHRVVEGQRNEQRRILRETAGREANFQKLLTKVEQQQQEIQREIFELEDQLRRTLDPTAIPTPRPGVLAWPHEGILTQRYGSTSETGFQNSVYSFHNGIDISAGFGTPIKAARDGVVSAAGTNGRFAYGKWLSIEHDNGLTTMYAHLSGWNVQEGQSVRAGDIVGFEGSTGFSTGAHLHFTVYVTHTLQFLDRWYGLLPVGASVDPMEYL